MPAARGVKRRISCIEFSLTAFSSKAGSSQLLPLRNQMRILRLRSTVRCRAGASPAFTRHTPIVWIVDAGARTARIPHIDPGANSIQPAGLMLSQRTHHRLTGAPAHEEAGAGCHPVPGGGTSRRRSCSLEISVPPIQGCNGPTSPEAGEKQQHRQRQARASIHRLSSFLQTRCGPLQVSCPQTRAGTMAHPTSHEQGFGSRRRQQPHRA
jgi:hypothetical protein